MVKSEEGFSMPLCVWNQKEENAAATAEAEVEVSEDVAGLSDPAKSLCIKCRQKLPASFLVQVLEAMEAGWLSQ